MLNMLRQSTDCSIVNKRLADEALKKYKELAREECQNKFARVEDLRNKACEHLMIEKLGSNTYRKIVSVTNSSK